MLNIRTFESGSTGNLHLVETGEHKLLLECGLPFSKIKKYLDFNLGVDGCLISHYHNDHSESAKHLMKAGIDVYCSNGTSEFLGLKGHRLKEIAPGNFKVGNFNCFAFLTNHDTPGAMGFLISKDNERILFATDTGSMPYRFTGLTKVMIECNHSQESMDELDPIASHRIMKTHMSLNDTIDFLSINDLSLVTEIHLIHLSSRNSDAEYFKTEIMKLTGKPVIIG